MRPLGLLSIFLASSPAAWAASGCNYTLGASSVNLTYDPDNPTDRAITFTVQKTGGRDCAYGVTFSKGGAADYSTRRVIFGSSTVGYQLSEVSGSGIPLRDVPDLAGLSSYIEGIFTESGNATHTLTYFARLLPPSTLPPAGTYLDNYRISVYEGSNPADWPSQSPEQSSVSIQTSVPKLIQISLVSPGAPFNQNDTTENLNYGTMTTGAVRALDIKVRSNAGYKLEVSSTHNGRMKNSNAAVTTTIPYSFKVNSVTKDLSSSSTSPVLVGQGPGQTAASGVTFEIAAELQSVDGKMAGSYSDSITVVATSTE